MEGESAETVQMYTPGYLLGTCEDKESVLKHLFKEGNTLKLPKLELFAYHESSEPPPATETFFPFFTNRTTLKFKEEEYFKILKTKVLGRTILFFDVLTSSMDIVDGAKLKDGFAVIALRQTHGRGRGGTTWVSPEGCALFSIQLHISKNSYLGQHLLLVQYVAGLSIVSSVSSLPGYEGLNLRLKWPNDIYFGSYVKIGGVLLTSTADEDVFICNVGCGTNIDNEAPTTCINTLIRQYNLRTGESLELLSLEKFIAVVFNRMEELLEKVQTGNTKEFFDLYYKFWLHSDMKITVTDSVGASNDVTILGIDENGFIVVQDQFGKCFSLHPGENSFDLLRGLISPKQKVHE